MYMIHSKLKLQGLFDEVRELSRSEVRIRLDGLESMKWRFLSFWFFEDPMKLRTHWSLELLVSAWGWVVLDEREWFAVTDHRITRSRESLISSVWFKSSSGSFLILSSYSGLQHRIAPRMMGVRKHQSWSNPVPRLDWIVIKCEGIRSWSEAIDLIVDGTRDRVPHLLSFTSEAIGLILDHSLWPSLVLVSIRIEF